MFSVKKTNQNNDFIEVTCFIQFRASKINEDLLIRIADDINENTEFYSKTKTADAAKENFKSDHFTQVFLELPKSMLKEIKEHHFKCLTPSIITRENIQKIIYYPIGNAPTIIPNKGFVSFVAKQQFALEKKYLAEQKAETIKPAKQSSSKEEWIELKTLWIR